MGFVATDIPGVLIFEPKVFGDNRGYFYESYNASLFEKEGIRTQFVQDNQSSSSYGVIRGLHFQLQPHTQVKLIRVLSGTILDVVVDMRKGSPAYGRSLSIKLDAENKKQLYIPAGLAHGFSVLSERAEILYKCDRFYNKESESGILYNDPALNIDWQIPPDKAIISDKDKVQPLLADCKTNFVFEQ